MYYSNEKPKRYSTSTNTNKVRKDYSQYTRQRPEKEMIFGIRAVLEAIQAGKDIEKILIRRDLGGDLARELFEVIKGTSIPVQRVPMEKLNRTTQKNHQGVLAFIWHLYRLSRFSMYLTLYQPFMRKDELHCWSYWME